MKFLYYILFIINIDKVELYFINNQYKPICSNCKFFIPNKNECRKFSDVNIITGESTYETASSVRNDEDKCGEYAILFEKNNFKFITIPYYFMLENDKIFFILTLNFLPFILLYMFSGQ